MIKQCTLLFLLCSSFVTYTHGAVIPTTIDFANLNEEQIIKYDIGSWDGIESICKPFEGAIELIPYFDELQQTFQIEEAVKTGTWDSGTTNFLSFLCENVLSPEYDMATYNKAAKEKLFNIQLAFGFSPDMLKEHLPSRQGKRVLFYLAPQLHSPRYLKQELQVIGESHYDNCIVVISHCKIPKRNDLPYDMVEGQECSYNYIRSSLSKVFSSPVCYYIIPRTLGCSAKLVIIPKQWIKE